MSKRNCPIRKHTIPINQEMFSLRLTQTAQVLKVETQGTQAVLWVHENRDLQEEEFHFLWFETDDNTGMHPRDATYIGTIYVFFQRHKEMHLFLMRH